jgi:hypothetical protein
MQKLPAISGGGHALNALNSIQSDDPSRRNVEHSRTRPLAAPSSRPSSCCPRPAPPSDRQDDPSRPSPKVRHLPGARSEARRPAPHRGHWPAVGGGLWRATWMVETDSRDGLDARRNGAPSEQSHDREQALTESPEERSTCASSRSGHRNPSWLVHLRLARSPGRVEDPSVLGDGPLGLLDLLSY